MRILVQKFGGTSVATRSSMQNVLTNVLRATQQGYKVIAVLSAISGETNRLLALAHEYSENPLLSEIDVLLSTGEQVAVALFSILGHDAGLKIRSMNASQIPMYTSPDHSSARIERIATDTIYSAFSTYDVLVITGFQGITQDGRITTLGRGGSDTTAVALAASLNSAPCEIYTDVEGVYTTDPNICSKAKKLDVISYDEMLEMASMGAKVLQIRSVLFAKRYNVPLYVRSTFSNSEGTFLIHEEDIMESQPVSGIAYDKNQAMISINNASLDSLVILFKAIAERKILVDMIVQSISSQKLNITFSISQNNLKETLTLVEGIAGELGNPEISYEDSLSKISIVGYGMRDHTDIATSMFETLASEGIPILLINTSEIKISCLIHDKYTELAVRSLHEVFFSEEKHSQENKSDT